MSEINAPTFDEMREVIIAVKTKYGLDRAKRIIRDFGKTEMMGDIEAENFEAVIREGKRILDTHDAPVDVVDELDKPINTIKVSTAVITPARDPRADYFHCCSAEMMDSAVDGLNSMPEGATVEQAINAIYNAWVHAGFVKHDA